MAIKPNINPYTDAGNFNEKRSLKLEAMEAVIALDRDFYMSDVDEGIRDEVRWCWDSDLIEVVDSKPLKYRVTALGYGLVAKAQAQRMAMQDYLAA